MRSSLLFGTDVPDSEPEYGAGAQAFDLRLVGPAVGAWVTAALLIGGTAAPAAWLAFLLVLLTVVAVVRVCRRPAPWKPTLAALLACCAAAAVACAGRLAALEASPVADLAAREAPADLEVEISEPPRPRAGGDTGDESRPAGERHTVAAMTVTVTVPAHHVGADHDSTDHHGADHDSAHRSATRHDRRLATRVPVVLITSGPGWGGLLPGQRLRVSGPVVPADGGGRARALVLVRGPPDEVRPPPEAQAWAGRVRARLHAASAGLPSPADALLPAFVAGDAARVPADVREDFRASGMTHLMVVSGTHLAVLTGAALAAARWSRLPPWAAAAVAACLIAAMVLVAGPRPSVLRAALMALIALAALAAGRTRGGLAALSAAVLALVLVDPHLSRAHGFALSVLATGGIMVLAPGWSRALRARVPLVPRWAADAAAVALASQLACLPVLVLLTPEIGWVGVPANTVATPLVPIAMTGGFATAVAASVLPSAAPVLAWIPGAAVLGIAAIARTAADLHHAAPPLTAPPWRGDAAGALALAVLVAAVLVLRGRARTALLSGLTAAAVSVAATTCALKDWPPDGWALTACDVGQGDALVLATGGGQAVLVDTGERDAGVDPCLRDLGVGRLSLLVLTHDHSDHMGDTVGALRGRTAHAALAPGGFETSSGAEHLRAEGVPLHAAEAGQTWTTGPWTLTVLWPERGTDGDGDAGHSENDRSVVLHARWAPPPGADALPMTVLLTGDIEEPAQRALMHEGGVHGVDVLKTPHHGAKTQEEAFLTATGARLVLTSVGRDNSYGHPSPETLAVLEGLTTEHYRTDLHGDVAVVPGPGGPEAVARGRAEADGEGGAPGGPE
ncbi:ComEC/Rec2 family competence protein [Nocardiopsis sp. RSe5-2]|uniref:ComEC/Rec2 family competence protein n=1 Tax=Nocardiopsis endophytica TaxID=3018445 RepID=A0ABT4U577_9ACTN|nr:ComEC/Rec2 family competence protein [Nocardiopsis endophytica]MDA2812095.1 ComEC/Rec2 family competence protein [Nocardiopsis endophytica]